MDYKMLIPEDYIAIANIITETDWDDERIVRKNGFQISQFQGTIFLSDYQCFKVEYKDNIIVAKVTNKSEYLILKQLREDGFSVPTPIYYLIDKAHQSILLFEQFLPGRELSTDASSKVWEETAIQLAQLHLKYWESYKKEPMFQQGTVVYQEKLENIVKGSYFNMKWRSLIQKIVLRFNEVPHTVVHGDAFPSNFLISGEQVSFIDLANAGIMPYMVDIARLTCLPGFKEDSLLCPYKEDVQDIYYKQIRQRLNLTKEDFLFDVKLASFIELATIYVPPIGINAYSLMYKCKENQTIERMLHHLANELV